MSENIPAPIVSTEKKGLAIASLVLSLPAPILLLILWAVLFDKSDTYVGEKAISAIGLYLALIFMGTPASITSLVLGIIATVKSRRTARVLGIVSLVIAGATLVLLIAFTAAQS